MNVIPTSYRGITFRSRAEARWAVVFDVLNWRFHYEPEGYFLPSGGYFPDFLLFDLDAFFEVKGRAPTRVELLKAEELCTLTERVVIISHGPPNPKRHEWERDLTIFNPERDLDDVPFADQHNGGFVSGRWSDQTPCSIDLGNLGYLRGRSELGWESAFRLAANHRFGLYPEK